MCEEEKLPPTFITILLGLLLPSQAIPFSQNHSTLHSIPTDHKSHPHPPILRQREWIPSNPPLQFLLSIMDKEETPPQRLGFCRRLIRLILNSLPFAGPSRVFLTLGHPGRGFYNVPITDGTRPAEHDEGPPPAANSIKVERIDDGGSSATAAPPLAVAQRVAVGLEKTRPPNTGSGHSVIGNANGVKIIPIIGPAPGGRMGKTEGDINERVERFIQDTRHKLNNHAAKEPKSARGDAAAQFQRKKRSQG